MSNPKRIVLARKWTAPEVQLLAGTVRFRDYGSFVEYLIRDDVVVFADCEQAARTIDRSDALKAIGARSILNIFLTNVTA